MADIINLNKARKIRAKAAMEDRASQNRVIHGRKKEQKEADEARRKKHSKELDGRKLDGSD